VVQHSRRDNAGKRAIRIWHRRCISPSHPNSVCCRPLLQRSRQDRVNLEAGKAGTTRSQPIGRQTWPRSNFEYIVSQFYVLQRPRQNFGIKLLPPPSRSAIPLMQTVHASTYKPRGASPRLASLTSLRPAISSAIADLSCAVSKRSANGKTTPSSTQMCRSYIVRRS
jgi:hypothetical protein